MTTHTRNTTTYLLVSLGMASAMGPFVTDFYLTGTTPTYHCFFYDLVGHTDESYLMFDRSRHRTAVYWAPQR